MNRLEKLYKYTFLIIFSITISIFVSGCELIVLRQPYTVITLTDIDQMTPSGVVLLFKRELDSLNTTAVLSLMTNENLKQFNGAEKFSHLSSVQRLLYRSKGKNLFIKNVQFSNNPTSAIVKATFNYIEPIEFSVIQRNERWFVTSWN